MPRKPGVRLALLPLPSPSPSSVYQSPLPIPAQPSFIFRVFGDERKQLLCTLSKSEWAEGGREGGKERGETEGGKIKKSGSRLDTSGEAGRKQEERETKKGRVEGGIHRERAPERDLK